MGEILDVKEACQFLKLAKPTLYKHVRAGNIPAVKVGRSWRFHKETLDAWIKKGVETATQTRSEQGKGR